MSLYSSRIKCLVNQSNCNCLKNFLSETSISIKDGTLFLTSTCTIKDLKTSDHLLFLKTALAILLYSTFAHVDSVFHYLEMDKTKSHRENLCKDVDEKG